MKIAIVLAILSMSGCYISNEEIETCRELCSVNGGITFIVPVAAGNNICECINGAKFNLK